MGRILLSAVTMLAMTACATNKPPPGPEGPRPSMGGALVASPISLVFATYDADADKIVTLQEMQAGVPAEWRSADSDGDGQVSSFELRDWATSALGSPTARPNRLAFDNDGDGSVSLREFQRHMKIEFDVLDDDGDTRLTRAELVRETKVQSSIGRRREKGIERAPQ